MRLFGLIGYPLDHSFSAKWFSERFAAAGIADAEYRNFPLESIKELPRLLAAHENLEGFNVTIPYKEAIIPYLDSLSQDAAETGAVNCVVRNGKALTGYNTDWQGFRDSLQAFIGRSCPRALILGSGGSSKAIAYAMRTLEIEYLTVSRGKTGRDMVSYQDLTPAVMDSRRLIINTTPLGTYPNTASFPDIPYELLTPEYMLFDLVYNPPLTRFLEKGHERGCRTCNGEEMLRNQAELSFKLFGL